MTETASPSKQPPQHRSTAVAQAAAALAEGDSASRMELPEVDLKDPVIAAGLAWLIPGAGHLYQRRLAKGILFLVCILSLYVTGVALGSGPQVGLARAAYMDPISPFQRRLSFFAQAGTGLTAVPAVVQMLRARADGRPREEWMYPPVNDQELNRLHFHLGRYFDHATVYLMVAGLLNILVIYDAYAGPVIILDEVASQPDQPADKHQGASNSSPDDKSPASASQQPTQSEPSGQT